MSPKNIHTTFDRIMNREDKEKLLNQHSAVIWFTGLSGSGKTTVARLVARASEMRFVPFSAVLSGIKAYLGPVNAAGGVDGRRIELITLDDGGKADVAAKNTRTLVGRIVSDKRSKTVTVLVERRTAHELYGKIVAKSSKYHAHDEKGEFKMGDMIEITESRPISKTKNWVATRLVEKAAAV